MRDLKILEFPDQPRQAVQVGVYWQYMPAPEDLETCDLRIVICTNNGEVSTEIP